MSSYLDQTMRDQLIEKYGEEDGQKIADLLQQCIEAGHTDEKSLKKCLKEALRRENLEETVSDKSKDSMAGILASWITIG